jgi:probable rRNA maturation factor
MKSDPHITCRRKPASLDLDALESFARNLRRTVARGREFHCLLTGDQELQSLNREFRQKDYPTDVLSFPAERQRGRTKKDEPDRIGDIAISLARARAQAREWRHPLEDEIRILMLHGVLHLTGMDHETDSGQMRRAETRWRKKFSLPTALTERVP